ncbi:hypothetical protein SMICM304S_11183 [Streptomyces microflavus]
MCGAQAGGPDASTIKPGETTIQGRPLPALPRRALAAGDIMIDINITDSKPISKKDIRVLAERQLERL